MTDRLEGYTHFLTGILPDLSVINISFVWALFRNIIAELFSCSKLYAIFKSSSVHS